MMDLDVSFVYLNGNEPGGEYECNLEIRSFTLSLLCICDSHQSQVV